MKKTFYQPFDRPRLATSMRRQNTKKGLVVLYRTVQFAPLPLISPPLVAEALSRGFSIGLRTLVHGLFFSLVKGRRVRQRAKGECCW